MNIARTEEMIRVMQAFVAGEEIQCWGNFSWVTMMNPTWDWANNKYRIKPKIVTMRDAILRALEQRKVGATHVELSYAIEQAVREFQAEKRNQNRDEIS